jgi:DNA polymerase III alpha subunit
LGHLKDSVDIILQNRQVHVDIHRVKEFQKDEAVIQQLEKADTIGCFYIESPAMRGLLTKLRCKDYKTLVAASSIIRPGVAKSGMMREYIYRFQNPGKYEYLHPIFKEILGETFGIMVYQEDVIKIAHHFGGLELGEADVLRRVMSGKGRSRKQVEEIERKFFNNCKDKGYTPELAAEVWRQIESFSGFSFCKAHSASFAVESYQSLYLKTHFPLEFMVGVINNFGGFYRTEIYVHEARMCGADIQAPCVNNSHYLSTIQGKTIYLGFVHLKDLNEKVAKGIVKERERNGPYSSLENFVRRSGIGKEQLCILIRIGALRFTGIGKQELLWEKNQFVATKRESLVNEELFAESTAPALLPPLETEDLEDVYEQIELLGFPLISPFDLLKTTFRGEIRTRDMGQHLGQTVRMLGYYVAKKDTRTSKGQYMNFGTWIDDQGKFFDTTHFPNSLAKYPFQGNGCYLLKGKVVEDFGFPSLEVEKMARLEWKELDR